MYDKEAIYDEKISPLVKKIIEICKEEDIQMLFSCYLKNDDVGQLKCTTYIPSNEENCPDLGNAKKVLSDGYVAQRPYFFAAGVSLD